MSPVDFKKCQCRMSLLLIYVNVTCQFSYILLSHVALILEACHMPIISMLYVEFKKLPYTLIHFLAYILQNDNLYRCEIPHFTHNAN